MELKRANYFDAIALALIPCRVWQRAETFRLEKVEKMLDRLTYRAREANAPAMEGNEQPSGAVIEMFAGTERRPRRCSVHLRIGEF